MGGELGAVLGAVCTILITLLAFQGKKALDKIEALEARTVSVEKDVAVSAASKVAERVQALEMSLGELKSDVKHIVKMLEGDKK